MNTEINDGIKVYELAKELGFDSLSLISKLKEISIEVKNHMSELSADQVKSIRDHFLNPQPAAAATKTVKTTKAVTVRKKATTSTEAKTSETAKKAASTVIRRRTKTDGEVETVKTETTVSKTGIKKSKQTTLSTSAEELKKAKEAQDEQLNSIESDTNVTENQEFNPSNVEGGEIAASAEAVTEAQPTKRGLGLNMPSLFQARKDGLTSKDAGSIISVVKDQPRKPIAKPANKPAAKTTDAKSAGTSTVGNRPASGITHFGKEAIDKMVEEEQQSAKKRGKEERDTTNEVKISDYRAKKELIFLPKKKKPNASRELQKTQITTPAAHKRVVKIQNSVTVSDLAQRLGIKTGELIKKLIGMGMMATVNQMLDIDTATLIATEYGFEVENVAFVESDVIKSIEDSEEQLVHRAPIVTVMGHVDHGKTSLLDAIRSAKVAQGEAGGITQHIGAYTVDLDGKKITFIDTPGHEAFTMMRARGASVTDIVILVVAADDGVMPQTREAVDHAKAAGVPIIVAVNKIDKPQANPDRVLKGLAEIDVLSEEWGGQTIFARVSALQKKGIKELLEAILLQAEVLDLKANPNRPAEGVVLEARMDKGKGVVANILVKKGTLKVGDIVVAGPHCGRVRAMTSHTGQLMKEIGPSTAAELLGLEGVPTAGDTFNAVATDADARKIADHRIEKIRATTQVAKPQKVTLEDLFSKVQTGELKELPVILKTDVFGSSEAIKDALNKVGTEKVKVKVLSSSTGGVSESDVMLATASNAIILGFNVRPETKALQLAERENVEIKTYTIIYELIDDVKKAMGGLLEKKAVEKYLGRAEVRETFSVPKIGVIAGCAVIDGKIIRGCQVRLLRENRVIYTGKLGSLKRFKDDAKEVAQGYECGMGIENFNDIKQGDIIEAFNIEMIAQELTDNPNNEAQAVHT